MDSAFTERLRLARIAAQDYIKHVRGLLGTRTLAEYLEEVEKETEKKDGY